MTKLSSPVVLALCAGCLLLGSTGGAVAGAKITGKQIKNESVTGKDVKNRSLTEQDLTSSTVAGLQGPPGLTGPAGPTGPKGNNGTPGTPGTDGTDGTDGVSNYLQSSSTSASISAGGDGDVSKTCTSGRKLLSATGSFTTATVHPVTVIYDDDNTASVFTKDVPVTTSLRITIICANAG